MPADAASTCSTWCIGTKVCEPSGWVKCEYGWVNSLDLVPTSEGESAEEPEEDDGELLRKVACFSVPLYLIRQIKRHVVREVVDSSRQYLLAADITVWDDDALAAIKDRFVTGTWSAEDDAEQVCGLRSAYVAPLTCAMFAVPLIAQILAAEAAAAEEDGDFEDLETGEKHVAEPQPAAAEGTDAAAAAAPAAPAPALSGYEKHLQKKEKMKAMFDAEYDGGKSFYDELREEAAEQASANRAEFAGEDEHARIQFEGHRPGLYVRIELRGVPCELVKHFDPAYPLIVGGLQPGEQSLGYVHIKVKRHRWFGRTLKTRDPLIFSLGWRRFQAVPIYAMQDHNMRTRMLKYTPEHMHCLAAIYGASWRPYYLICCSYCPECGVFCASLLIVLVPVTAALKRRARNTSQHGLCLCSDGGRSFAALSHRCHWGRGSAGPVHRCGQEIEVNGPSFQGQDVVLSNTCCFFDHFSPLKLSSQANLFLDFQKHSVYFWNVH